MLKIEFKLFEYLKHNLRIRRINKIRKIGLF